MIHDETSMERYNVNRIGLINDERANKQRMVDDISSEQYDTG